MRGGGLVLELLAHQMEGAVEVARRVGIMLDVLMLAKKAAVIGAEAPDQHGGGEQNPANGRKAEAKPRRRLG